MAKALATGSVFVDCKLISHSDTSPTELDDIEVHPEAGPLAISLAGTVLTGADVTGVDLVCSITDGAAAVSRIQLVAMQVSDVVLVP
ncbi:MAG TPA: hypothetical protein VGN09_28575 [Vicinamibacteria bacterium]